MFRSIMCHAAVALTAGMAWGTAEAGNFATDFTLIGHIKPRSSAESAAAGIAIPFSIGAETTDRGYSTYDLWKSYLGPLGMQKARVQSGWATIERVPGQYNFNLLDSIVDDMRSQKVQPYLFLGYGNEYACPTVCGNRNSSSPLPVGAGLDKWLAFVKATVKHYNEPTVRVTEWEIWNEPDLNNHISAADFGPFAVATAQAIKSVQPGARLILGSFAGVGGTATAAYAYANTVLNHFDANRGATVPARDVYVAYHPYWPNPDLLYGSPLDSYRAMVENRPAPNNGYKILQGENGAPDQNWPSYALANQPFTEEGQAGYALRRLVSDFWLGIRSNLFTMVDLHYPDSLNPKGMLRTGVYDKTDTTPPLYGDQSVTAVKPAYKAVQNLTSVFDTRLQPVASPGCTAPSGYTVKAFTRNDGGGVIRNMLAVWRNTDIPGTNTTPVDINITCTGFNFPRFASNGSLRPRYADLFNGNTYQLNSATTVVNSGAGVSVSGLRATDHPVLLADQGIVLYN